jgi:hypothetical protein
MKKTVMALGLCLAITFCFSQATTKIPITPVNWYQLNNAGTDNTPTSGLQQLTDGNLADPVFMGWGKLLPVYDCYYEFKGLSSVQITKIRMYDGQGSFRSAPFRLYAKASPNSTPVLLATSTGDGYNVWEEISLPGPVKAQYLIINTSGYFPNELELYGTYTSSQVQLSPRQDVKFSDMTGTNSFVWDFMENWDDINSRNDVYEPKMKLMQAFSQYRDYVDWEKIEPVKGTYTFNPTTNGNWDYDKMYKRLKSEGKTVLACLKTLPKWFQEENYPSSDRDAENIPAAYNADLNNPWSYVLQAKMAFQFAARYGSNRNVASWLLNGVMTGVVYPNAPQYGSRTKEIGLDLIRYIECENERDKWWKGRKAYQTAREYAANLSAFYDGHINTMGSGVGVKNADPNMKVVIGGTAATSPDYIRGIIDWCREFRGYRPDGSVNLCFDIINYHCYSFQAGAGQYSNAGRGQAPELAGSANYAGAMVALGREYNAEVWITEGGYDVNQGSPLRAPAIGQKDPTLVQADWILRTALLYARLGIKKMFFYQAYDENISNGGQFASCGLLDRNRRTRKAASDYLFQVKNLIGNHSWKETLPVNNMVVDRYVLNSESVYALVVPDEKDRRESYTLQLGSDSALIYTPKAGSEEMTLQRVKTNNGNLTLTVSETPVFVKRKGVTTTPPPVTPPPTTPPPTTPPPTTPPVTHPGDITQFIDIVPNPVWDQMTIRIVMEETGPVVANIYESGSGRLMRSFSFVKRSRWHGEFMKMEWLPRGIYTIEVLIGNNRGVKTILKL